jgi:hypothetical protein
MSQEISQYCIQNRKLCQSYPKHPRITCVHCSRKQRGTHLPCEICKQEEEGRKCKVGEITKGAITRLRYEEIQTVEIRPCPKTRSCLTRKHTRRERFWYSFLLTEPTDALISQIYSCQEMHVSGNSSAHHQEFSTVHSALVYIMQV